MQLEMQDVLCLDRSQMEGIGRERTAKEWISLAEQAIEAGTLNLLLTGGEPLIRNDFEEIYTALANMGFIITLNTNATLITSKLLKLFQKYPPTATNVTLYGASKDTYLAICSNPDGFDQTIRGLEMLLDVPTEIEVRTTFIKDNMHELDQIRSIANRYTRRFAINVSVNKSIRGSISDIESCRLTPSQIFEVGEANSAYYRKLNNGTASVEKNMDTDHFVYIRENGLDIQPVIISCLAAKSMYWITWDGKMLPCGTFSGPFTLPYETGFRQAWDELPLLFENIKQPEECVTCELSDGKCSNCPAMLQAETGSFDRVSPYICNIARERAHRISAGKY